jgi:hypothetical protein
MQCLARFWPHVGVTVFCLWMDSPLGRWGIKQLCADGRFGHIVQEIGTPWREDKCRARLPILPPRAT